MAFNSLDCPSLIAPSAFSNVYLRIILTPNPEIVAFTPLYRFLSGETANVIFG
jgi:hypothetical protein